MSNKKIDATEAKEVAGGLLAMCGVVLSEAEDDGQASTAEALGLAVQLLVSAVADVEERYGK